MSNYLKLVAPGGKVDLTTKVKTVFRDGMGFYTPTVSEEGDLSWTVSNEDIPAVEEVVNIKGPAGEPGKDFTYEDFTPEQLEALKGEPGDSGIYVGSEAPTDENVYLWIDTEMDQAEAITEAELNQAIAQSEQKTETAIQEAINSITIVDEVSF